MLVLGTSATAADSLGDQSAVLGDRRAQFEPVGLEQARLELGDEDAPLTLRRRATSASRPCEAVPGLGERDEVGAPAAAVCAEHRTDAAGAVGVGAHDDAFLRLYTLEHRPAGGERQAVDGQSEALDRAAALAAVSLTSEDQLQIVQEAERLGYDSVWAAEAYGSDTATVLGWLAGQTSKIKLGSGIFQMPGRSAAMTAMTAATIDQLSGGRMILGIGSSGPQVAEGWHGQRFAKQLQRTREYVAVVRMALARERVEFHGETLDLPLPDGPGKALKLTISPVQERIPIYLAAIGPKNTALAGEIADGWIPTLFSPEHVSDLRKLLQEGADTSGKSLDGFDIAPTVSLCISDDLEEARNTMRAFIALYVGGMGSREQNFYNQLVSRYGYEAEAKTIQDLYLDGKREEAMAAVPEKLIDTVSLCGPKDLVRDRLAAYRDAGVGTLGVTPTAFAREERLEQMRMLAELAA